MNRQPGNGHSLQLEATSKVKRFNSIPVLFGLMAVVLAAICSWIQFALWTNETFRQTPFALLIAAVGLLIATQASITFLAAIRPTNHISLMMSLP